MEFLHGFFSAASDFVWGPAMLVLLLGTGNYLALGLDGLPLRRLGYGFSMLYSPQDMDARGESNALEYVTKFRVEHRAPPASAFDCAHGARYAEFVGCLECRVNGDGGEESHE